MNLSQYMEKRELSDAQMAELLGVGRSYVTLLRLGKRKPSLKVALKIEGETGGKVPATAWGEAA